MSHETDAEIALYNTIYDALQTVGDAIERVMNAQSKLPEATNEFLGTQQAAIGVILACDELQDAAKTAEAQCRAALVAAMSLGGTTIRTEHFTVSLRTAPKRALVTDETAIPLRFMHQPPPRPDLTAIAAALRTGQDIPGAVLTNGGADSLVIKRRT